MKKLVYVFLILFCGYLVVKTIVSSFFFLRKDRINFVVYGQETAIYSLGLSDDSNYFIPFDADTKVILPGGYGQYRVGAVGKIAFLDKKPILYKQAFSLSTGSFVDLYFYPSSSDIYYHTNRPLFSSRLPPLFFSRSNANLFERLFIAYLLTVRPRNQFKTLPFGGSDNFYKDYQGNFYSKVYRAEKLNVQLIYTKSYDTAFLLSRILEGEGIHVVDISSLSEAGKNEPSALTSTCKVEENTTKNFSETAKAMAAFFGCSLTRGHSYAYDILMTIGNVEASWNTTIKN